MGKRGPKIERVLLLGGGFLEDPKIRGLSAADKVEWLRVLLDHVRYGNGPDLPEHLYGLSRRRAERFRELGLLDEVEGCLQVHKWDEWNGREAYKRFLGRERVRRLRERRASEM